MGLFWKGRLAGNVCCKNHPALEPWHSVFVPAACVRSRRSGLHECAGSSPFSVKTLSFQRCPVVRVSWCLGRWQQVWVNSAVLRLKGPALPSTRLPSSHLVLCRLLWVDTLLMAWLSAAPGFPAATFRNTKCVHRSVPGACGEWW